MSRAARAPAALPRSAAPKILLVGDWLWPWYQLACARALEAQGCRVVKFGWTERFKRWLPGKAEPVYRSFAHRLQYRLMAGPIVWRINRDLLALAAAERPEVIWFYNVQLITARTVRKLKMTHPSAVLCQYANDNPFSPAADRMLWRHFKRSIAYFDRHLTFRESNIADFEATGARNVSLLRAYFIPEDDYPVPTADIGPRFRCDVVFAGHYEDDGRVDLLESICRAGYSLNLFGGGWDAALDKLAPTSPLRALFPVHPVVGDEYRQAICGARVALCFLSKLNLDSYTRRNFQIPAMRVAMLSEHTDDLSRLFRENEEACFFRTPSELLDRLDWLLADTATRDAVAEGGYRRVYADGHDVSSRMRHFVHVVREPN